MNFVFTTRCGGATMDRHALRARDDVRVAWAAHATPSSRGGEADEAIHPPVPRCPPCRVRAPRTRPANRVMLRHRTSIQGGTAMPGFRVMPLDEATWPDFAALVERKRPA